MVVYDADYKSKDPIKINAAAKPACLALTKDGKVRKLIQTGSTFFFYNGYRLDFKLSVKSRCKGSSVLRQNTQKILQIAMVCRRTVTLWTTVGHLTSTFTHPDFKLLHGICIDRRGRFVLTDQGQIFSSIS